MSECIKITETGLSYDQFLKTCNLCINANEYPFMQVHKELSAELI
jgi:hypothetical protein